MELACVPARKRAEGRQVGGSEGAKGSQLRNYVGDSMGVLKQAARIKTWNERCQEHPDHQTGMVSHTMIQARMQEEIDAFRAALALPEPKPCADESDCDHMPWCRIRNACQKQVRAALAQPEQLVVGGDDLPTLTKWTPQRKPLTDEEIAQIDWKDGETLHDFARAIERAHGIGGEHE